MKLFVNGFDDNVIDTFVIKNALLRNFLQNDQHLVTFFVICCI